MIGIEIKIKRLSNAKLPRKIQFFYYFEINQNFDSTA